MSTVQHRSRREVVKAKIGRGEPVGAGRNVGDSVLALHTGCRTQLGSLDHDSGTDERLAGLSIPHVARHRADRPLDTDLRVGRNRLRRLRCIQRGRANQAENPARDDCRDCGDEDVLHSSLLARVVRPSIVKRTD